MQTPVHCNDPVCATGTNNSQVMIDFGNQSLRSMISKTLYMHSTPYGSAQKYQLATPGMYKIEARDACLRWAIQ